MDPLPLSATDHFPAKEVLTHAGLVFAGHLDVERLERAASKITTVYPELDVVVKRRWYPLGLWYSAKATAPAWTFKHRHLPDSSLDQVFSPAAAASGLNLGAADKVTHLGAVNYMDCKNLFSFDGPSVNSHGWVEAPILNFRATLLGTPEDGHTLLSLIVPHLIFDAVSAGHVIEAWGKLYSGKEVAPRTGDLHPDLLSLVDGSDVKSEEKLDQGLTMGFFNILAYAREIGGYAKKGIEEHYVHVPRAILEKYRDEARKAQPQDHKGLPVSRFDIFNALCIKLISQSELSPDKSQPFDFYCVHSLLPAFPEGSMPEPYLHNCYNLGYHSLPSCEEVASMPTPELATKLRARLNFYRTPASARDQLQFHKDNVRTMFQCPQKAAGRGWMMSSSWSAVDEKARAGFEGEKLLFGCPTNEYVGALVIPNIVWSFGDGEGGVFARISTVKGDWEAMWEKAGFGELKG